MPLPLLLLPLLAAASVLRLPPPAGAACSPKACGNLTIAYPFWLDEGDGQPPCGSPSFQLTCDGTQALLAHSVFGLYQVSEIFTVNSSFVAVDHNLLVPSPAGCPARIGLGPYAISGKNRELLVLYNCKGQQQATPPPGFLRTPCRNESFFHLGEGYGSQRRRGLPLCPRPAASPSCPFLGSPAAATSTSGA